MSRVRPDYEAMVENAAVDAAIAEAEAEYQQTGQLFDAKDALADLRRKIFSAERDFC